LTIFQMVRYESYPRLIVGFASRILIVTHGTARVPLCRDDPDRTSQSFCAIGTSSEVFAIKSLNATHVCAEELKTA
jgi:hypothetical protein